MPVKYDKARDAYKCSGVFCGFGCMKAHDGTDVSGVDQNLIERFETRLKGRGEDGAVRAPPRRWLKAFGGHASIQEFKSKAERHGLVYDRMPHNVVLSSQVAHDRQACEARRKRNAVRHDMTEQVNLRGGRGGGGGGGGVPLPAESLKLKWAKPAKKSTMLERKLGLVAT
jgi:hypothetical protein